jgi:hypothetical protein
VKKPANRQDDTSLRGQCVFPFIAGQPVKCVINTLTFTGPRNPTSDACYPPFCLLHFFS